MQSNIFFIGNTGAGKSCCISYLYGCEMERVDPTTIPGLVAMEDVVVVSDSSALKLPNVEIGHEA